jgi:hypothetical protein
MQNKLFEVRDRATFIPVMAIHIDGNCTDQEDWLLRRSGYGKGEGRDYVYLIHLQTGEGQYDPYKWGCCSRTLYEAHRYIVTHFDKLQTGDVIDVEFILGESVTKKTTERY